MGLEAKNVGTRAVTSHFFKSIISLRIYDRGRPLAIARNTQSLHFGEWHERKGCNTQTYFLIGRASIQSQCSDNPKLTTNFRISLRTILLVVDTPISVLVPPLRLLSWQRIPEPSFLLYLLVCTAVWVSSMHVNKIWVSAPALYESPTTISGYAGFGGQIAWAAALFFSLPQDLFLPKVVMR